MKNDKTKVECRLVVNGTDKANANAVDDLAIPDPEPAVGEQAIKEATEKDVDEDDQPKTSR